VFGVPPQKFENVVFHDSDYSGFLHDPNGHDADFALIILGSDS
jgi:hypothetical protein